MAAGRWLNFFKNAGIPDVPASEYAVIFSDNRMRMDMLNELQKEILQDLGIQVMGDILAILRHGKKVYAEISRSAAEEFDVNRTKSSQQKKRPANKMYSDLIKEPASLPLVKQNTEAKEVPVLKALPKRKPETTQTKPDVTDKAISSTKAKTSGRSLSERFTEYKPAPAKKKKDDTKEVITIKIPSEPTEKINQLRREKQRHPEKGQREATAARKTVFDRLGSDEKSVKSAEQRKPVTSSFQKLSRTTYAANTSLTKEAKSNASVFSRLGGNVTGTATATATSNGVSNQFGKITASSSRSDSSARQTFTITTGGDKSVKLGLQGSHSVLRPIKSVKPVPRKPLAMDMELVVQTKPSLKKMDTQPNYQPTTNSKSVFDRLGK